jgi:phosphatidate cytidylyltransferase
MLKTRIITSALLIPLVLIAVWFDEPVPWFTLLVLSWGALAVVEFYNLVNIHTKPLVVFGVAWTLLFIASPHWDSDIQLLLLTTLILLPITYFVVIRETKEGFIRWVWTTAGILYIGWLLSYFVALRGLEDGGEWVIFALLITFVSDSAGYLIGKPLGRHKLALSISPNKSWEGAISGAILAMVISPLLIWLLGLQIGFILALLLGFILSVAGQLGDLAESLFKRNMGVKDSGKGIPGHGGFLDRIDSLVFVGVVLFYLLQVFPS